MSAEICSVPGCVRPTHRRGFCNGCYQKALKAGLPRINTRPLEVRFWEKVNKTETCWLWTGAIADTGYGTIGRGGKAGGTILAHRLSYEMHLGPIPKGLHLDHLCRVRRCIRRDHLEPVTPRENVLRGVAPSAIAFRANACLQGHEYTPENTLVVSTTGKRQCRTCNRRRYFAGLRRRAGEAA